MIDNVITRELWVDAIDSDQWITNSVTVYVGKDYWSAPTVTVQTNLSRTLGGGIASAALSAISYFPPDGAEPVSRPYWVPIGDTEPEVTHITKQRSREVMAHCHSVSFILGAKRMSAASTGTVFVHSLSSLKALVTSPVKFIESLIGP